MVFRFGIILILVIQRPRHVQIYKQLPNKLFRVFFSLLLFLTQTRPAFFFAMWVLFSRQTHNLSHMYILSGFDKRTQYKMRRSLSLSVKYEYRFPFWSISFWCLVSQSRAHTFLQQLFHSERVIQPIYFASISFLSSETYLSICLSI